MYIKIKDLAEKNGFKESYIRNLIARNREELQQYLKKEGKHLKVDELKFLEWKTGNLTALAAKRLKDKYAIFDDALLKMRRK